MADHGRQGKDPHNWAFQQKLQAKELLQTFFEGRAFREVYGNTKFYRSD